MSKGLWINHTCIRSSLLYTLIQYYDTWYSILFDRYCKGTVWLQSQYCTHYNTVCTVVSHVMTSSHVTLFECTCTVERFYTLLIFIKNISLLYYFTMKVTNIIIHEHPVHSNTVSCMWSSFSFTWNPVIFNKVWTLHRSAFGPEHISCFWLFTRVRCYSLWFDQDEWRTCR